MNDLRTEHGLHWSLWLYHADTSDHCDRVGAIAGVIARQLGLSDDQVRVLNRAGRLHDIGKLDVPCHLLRKAGKLAADEWATMQRHPVYGVERIASLLVDETMLAVVIAHHERWDGSGYPRGLAGEQIPLAARIVAVADVYDALREERPYKAAWSHHEAMAYILAQSGTMFDPTVVAAFAVAAVHSSYTTTRGAP